MRYRGKWFVTYLYCLEKQDFMPAAEAGHKSQTNKAHLGWHFVSANQIKRFISEGHHLSTNTFYFKLHAEPYLSKPLYETCFFLFLPRSGSSPIIRALFIVHAIFKVAYKDKHFKTIVQKQGFSCKRPQILPAKGNYWQIWKKIKTIFICISLWCMYK